MLRVSDHHDGYALYGRRCGELQVPFETYNSVEELEQQLLTEGIDITDFEYYGDVPTEIIIKQKWAQLPAHSKEVNESDGATGRETGGANPSSSCGARADKPRVQDSDVVPGAGGTGGDATAGIPPCRKPNLMPVFTTQALGEKGLLPAGTAQREL